VVAASLAFGLRAQGAFHGNSLTGAVPNENEKWKMTKKNGRISVLSDELWVFG